MAVSCGRKKGGSLPDNTRQTSLFGVCAAVAAEHYAEAMAQLNFTPVPPIPADYPPDLVELLESLLELIEPIPEPFVTACPGDAQQCAFGPMWR